MAVILFKNEILLKNNEYYFPIHFFIVALPVIWKSCPIFINPKGFGNKIIIK